MNVKIEIYDGHRAPGYKATITLLCGDASCSIGGTPRQAYQRASCNARAAAAHRSGYRSQIGHYNRKFRTVRTA